MPPAWVNMVQDTQTSHLPDAYDPEPVEQGINVYYTDMLYGGVSFAVIEDRKWKSGPRSLLSPSELKYGHFDVNKHGYVEGAQLLGQRQLDFLEAWAADWSGDTRMKAVVSGTIFASVHTFPRTPNTVLDGVWAPQVEKGAYPPNDILAQDLDSNGWPRTPRLAALKKMRKAFAFHISGDTHVGTVVQYGIEDWGNASWVFGSPSISNVAARRWFPQQFPVDYVKGAPRNLGKFYDGLGNRITVRAVANPTKTDIEPVQINQLAPGYNILVFDTDNQTVEVQAWPRWVDPVAPGAGQFDGWPVRLKHTDNGFPEHGLKLPTLRLPIDYPTIQVIDERTNEIVYTVRLKGPILAPPVFSPGTYQVRVFDKEMNLLQEFAKLEAVPEQ